MSGSRAMIGAETKRRTGRARVQAAHALTPHRWRRIQRPLRSLTSAGDDRD